MLATQAAANCATIVDVYGASVGRSACAGSLTRWVEPYVPANAAAPLHPNLRGMQAMAAMVAASSP
jgi:lysophospholipase L1-like esterase